MNVKPLACRGSAVSILLAAVALCLAGAMMTAAQPAPAAAQPSATQPAASKPPGVPIRLDGETIYHVNRGLGPFSAEERARAAERRLQLIADDPFYSSELLTVVQKPTLAELRYRNRTVGVITAEDAAAAGVSADEAATALVQKVDDAVARYREHREPLAWTEAIAIMVVASGLLALLVFGLRRARRRLEAAIAARRRQALSDEQKEGLAAAVDQKTAPIQLKALGLLYYTAVLAAVTVYLGVAFAAVPMTKGYALAAIDYVIEPVRTLWQGFLASVGDVIFIAVVVVLARYLIKGLRWALSEAAAERLVIPGVSSDWAMLAFKVARIGVVAMAAVVIYPYIPGSDTDAFKGIGIFAGALFTIGASGMAGNIVGGLALTFAGTYHVGDRVKIGDVVGDVVETTLMMTRVRSIRNEIVTIPNSTILAGHIVNYSTEARSRGVLLVTEVTIGYDAPWRKVHELLIEAARRTPEILASPAPYVLQHSLNDYHVSYEIWAYTSNANAMVLTYGALHQNIQDSFNEGGVEILSPGYAALRDGNTTTIPESYRDGRYAAPSFRVRVADQAGRHGASSGSPKEG
jgi:small-conductance mechanosensitive channel